MWKRESWNAKEKKPKGSLLESSVLKKLPLSLRYLANRWKKEWIHQTYKKKVRKKKLKIEKERVLVTDLTKKNSSKEYEISF